MSRNYACMTQEQGKTDVNMLEMSKNKAKKGSMVKGMKSMMKKGMKRG